MHKLETMTISILNALYFVVVARPLQWLSLLLHPPPATPLPPLSLIPTSLIPLTHIHTSMNDDVCTFLLDLLRFLPWGPFIWFLLTLVDDQAVCNQRVKHGLNRILFWQAHCVTSSTGKRNCRVETDNSIIFWEVSCCYSTGKTPVRLIKMLSFTGDCSGGKHPKNNSCFPAFEFDPDWNPSSTERLMQADRTWQNKQRSSIPLYGVETHPESFAKASVIVIF